MAKDCIHSKTINLTAGWSIILAFTFTFGILSGQIGFVSLAPVTKYVLIVCYDNQIGNSLIEINTKIVFKFGKIIIYCFHWPDLANWPNVSNVILDRSVQAYIGQIWPLINGTICPHIEKI